MDMTAPLQQLSIQFRTKESFDDGETERLRANLATVLIGAAMEAGVDVVTDGGPLSTALHVHDSVSTGACPGCIRQAQDGRA